MLFGKSLSSSICLLLLLDKSEESDELLLQFVKKRTNITAIEIENDGFIVYFSLEIIDNIIIYKITKMNLTVLVTGGVGSKAISAIAKMQNVSERSEAYTS